MKIISKLLLFLLLSAEMAHAVALSGPDAARVGHKVWMNECGGTLDGLVSWNAGEAFPSLGIGHFIWYPAGNPGPFEESFPRFVALLKQRGAKLPSWMTKAAPWQNRAEMVRDSSRVRELRILLGATVGVQTEFLIQRLEAALPKMLASANAKNRDAVRRRFERLAATPSGAFALIDYVNFKGEGVLGTERYRGEGWGLLQVLEGMQEHGNEVSDFSEAAKRVLARRVRNAPPERHEQRWLAGWQDRVGRY
ncbi:MAG: hypothetical protein WCP06_13600 [Verrucomicrobiota bacterium]